MTSNTKNNNKGVYDLDTLIAQKEEATGVKGGRVSFNYKGETFTFKDPTFLTDDEVAELDELPQYGPDVCAWYMGDDEYDRFINAGGSSNMWALVLEQHVNASRGVDGAGNPTRSNRSQRRAAARKR